MVIYLWNKNEIINIKELGLSFTYIILLETLDLDISKIRL